MDINICAYTYFHMHTHRYVEQCITGQSAIQDKLFWIPFLVTKLFIRLKIHNPLHSNIAYQT